ncbi:MAG: hypothetical protein ACXVDJ_06830, partial [Tumebacillaceae bacterium]
VTMLPVKSNATGTFYQLTLQSKVNKPIQDVALTLVGSYKVSGSNLKAFDSMHVDNFYVNSNSSSITWEFSWMEDGKRHQDALVMTKEQ